VYKHTEGVSVSIVGMSSMKESVVERWSSVLLLSYVQHLLHILLVIFSCLLFILC